MKNLKVFSSAIAMLICIAVFAQKNTAVNESRQIHITGTVSDEQGSSLPGVNVIVKGTARGVQTDFNGKYKIDAKRGDQLVFSFLGMKTQAVTVEKSSIINVVLKEDATMLESVVVQGYNITRTKARSNVASVTVSSKAYEKSVGGKKQSKGKPAASQSNGVPGASTVMLRGIGSIAPNEALYIVDGIPVSREDFSKISPQSIEKVRFLKDTGATEIYGNRGAQGVMLVNTKNTIAANLSEEELNKKIDDIVKAPKLPAGPNDEDYDSFVENPFESPKATALSTFSIDVDNASYTNIRRFINDGEAVPKDAVRVEEMVNFFKYQYPQPTGEHPFSINTEYSECPWNTGHKLIRIGLQGKTIDTDALPASNLVFLIDVSGSMDEQNKLPLVVESLRILVGELRGKDKVSIVVYAGAAGMVLKPTPGNEKQTIIDALEKLSAGGSTAGGQGIELAYKLAQENFIKNGNNRVILATDGDFNVGSSSNSDMQALIEQKRKSGVFLTCLGYGMGNYKDSKMEILADKGNGNYAYIDNIQEANRFLGKEFKGSMFAIAKDVKIQIEFNPKHVQAYRLIGYENRKLRPEDFTDDAIDAGELGSGHTVTALYEIIPTGTASEFFSEIPPLKYTKTETTAGNFNTELATIKFRYKKPGTDKSTEMVKVIENKGIALNAASEDFRFSAAVAWFGLKLRDSKLVGNKSSDDIKKLAKTGLSFDHEGYRAEFIRLLEGVKVQI